MIPRRYLPSFGDAVSQARQGGVGIRDGGWGHDQRPNLDCQCAQFVEAAPAGFAAGEVRGDGLLLRGGRRAVQVGA
jgi:hypothetical protein